MKTTWKKLLAFLASLFIIYILVFSSGLLTGLFYNTKEPNIDVDKIIETYMNTTYPNVHYEITDINYQQKLNYYDITLINKDYKQGIPFYLNYDVDQDTISDDNAKSICKKLYDDYNLTLDKIEKKENEFNKYYFSLDCENKSYVIGMPYDTTKQTIPATFVYRDDDMQIDTLLEVKQIINKMDSLLENKEVNVQYYQIRDIIIPIEDRYNDTKLQELIVI